MVRLEGLVDHVVLPAGARLGGRGGRGGRRSRCQAVQHLPNHNDWLSLSPGDGLTVIRSQRRSSWSRPVSHSIICWIRKAPASSIFMLSYKQPAKQLSSQKRSREDTTSPSLPVMSHLLASRTAGIGRPLARQTLLSRSRFHSEAASKVEMLRGRGLFVERVQVLLDEVGLAVHGHAAARGLGRADHVTLGVVTVEPTDRHLLPQVVRGGDTLGDDAIGPKMLRRVELRLLRGSHQSATGRDLPVRHHGGRDGGIVSDQVALVLLGHIVQGLSAEV
ncbi:hypothetical protein EYF80_011506 [Liparis tanakae]|uniref:Uncharacterized protein n=1 Tax=Liparis tanakae TaxID=230148 RepID=A0A4Z2IK65_9TELE|nr:hypothetical protein EYF80_011506 [Liparis tanakae]